MAVSWFALVAVIATAFGATISLRSLIQPYLAPTASEPVPSPLKSDRIVRTLNRVCTYEKQLVGDADSNVQVLEKASCGHVWVTVHSPEIKIKNSPLPNIVDAIELNWNFNGCSDMPNQIGLFDDRPASWNNALSLYPIHTTEGYIITNTSLSYEILPAGWQNHGGVKGPHCLWPWVGAGFEDSIMAYNCLKIQPTWMEDNLEAIGHLRVGELAIAGAHNAGAWKFDTEISSVSRDIFVLCQDRSIWSQLVHGIRYLDFRIGYYDFYPEEEDRYWLNHNLIRVRPLMPLLNEIKAFLDATKEIVFLDAHHFPIGFYHPDGSPIRSVHEGLLKLVYRELGHHIAPASEFSTAPGTKGPTVKSLINANKRLLFSYVDNAIVGENSILWPILPHLWANTNNPFDLFLYLDEAISGHPIAHSRSPLYSAMAQTTPTVLDILFMRGSLRDNADAVNRNVTERLSTLWRQHANIVSTDFFLANDVIDVSLAINLERGRKL